MYRSKIVVYAKAENWGEQMSTVVLCRHILFLFQPALYEKETSVYFVVNISVYFSQYNFININFGHATVKYLPFYANLWWWSAETHSFDHKWFLIPIHPESEDSCISGQNWTLSSPRSWKSVIPLTTCRNVHPKTQESPQLGFPFIP